MVFKPTVVKTTINELHVIRLGIPVEGGKMLKKFTELKYGEEGIIKNITEFSTELSDTGIYKGKTIRMLSRLPVRKNVIVSTRGHMIVLPPEMASGILVEQAMETEFVRG